MCAILHLDDPEAVDSPDPLSCFPDVIAITEGCVAGPLSQDMLLGLALCHVMLQNTPSVHNGASQKRLTGRLYAATLCFSCAATL
jgi:hypothetical protein